MGLGIGLFPDHIFMPLFLQSWMYNREWQIIMKTVVRKFLFCWHLLIGVIYGTVESRTWWFYLLPMSQWYFYEYLTLRNINMFSKPLIRKWSQTSKIKCWNTIGLIIILPILNSLSVLGIAVYLKPLTGQIYQLLECIDFVIISATRLTVAVFL